MRIVLAEKVHPSAAETFREAGYDPEIVPNALDGDTLKSVLANAHVLGIRSRTRIDAQALEGARRLLAIGCFAIGTDQVALDAAATHGIPVFNAPHSSTRSVAEMAICQVVNLARQVPHRSMRMHQGRWEKSVTGAIEVRNKTLGIVGYGHIGQQVGLLGETLGMDVLFYDVMKKLPLGRARAVGSLDELLEQARFVTLHVPGGASTRNLIDAQALARMTPGSFLINLSRGTVVDIEALREALERKHLAGAAIDVHPLEPAEGSAAFATPLQGLDNVILTPHVGGSTEEAQRNIGREVATSLIGFLDSGASQGAVNFPQVSLPPFPEGHRILNVHRNVPGVLSAINRIIAEVDANIHAQYLSTYKDVGYLIMDISQSVSEEVRSRIAALPENVRTRILY
jgi:D-3-phosphoglycerate dehydrogenase